jgi:hypothetical protein
LLWPPATRAVWGGAIFGLPTSRVAAAAIGGRPAQIILGLVVPVVVILYGLRFSREYPKRITRDQPAGVPAGQPGR